MINSSLRDNVTNMIRPLLLVMFSSLALTIFSPLDVSAQHHGALPPAANLGDRKISLNFDSQPDPITVGQNADVMCYLRLE